jgi:hypothetical protein
MGVFLSTRCLGNYYASIQLGLPSAILNVYLMNRGGRTDDHMIQ